MTIEEQNKLAKRAVLQVLMRIKQDPQARAALGAGTETFDLLTATAAALTGSPLKTVRNNIAPGSGALAHCTAEEYLAEL